MPGRKISNERHTLEVEIDNKMMPHTIGKAKVKNKNHTVFSHCHRIRRNLNLLTISPNFIIQI